MGRDLRVELGFKPNRTCTGGDLQPRNRVKVSAQELLSFLGAALNQ